MSITIRPATADDSDVLTKISFAAKRYWQYPEEYFTIWQAELTITPDYIESNIVYAAEQAGQVVGYFSLVEVKEDFWAGEVFVANGFWLEHIFVLPEFIGQGIGTQLIALLKEKCAALKIARLKMFSDPNAKGFYDKLAADFLAEVPSSIAGRNVLLYELAIGG